MIKYFISSDLFNNQYGTFCLKGEKSDILNEYVITALIPIANCEHKNCLGCVLNVIQKPNISVDIYRNTVTPFGDNVIEKHSFNGLIIIYDEYEIKSLVPYCSENFLKNVGNDISFLFNFTAVNSNILIPYAEKNSTGNSNQSNSKPNQFISKILRSSYLYRISKYKIDSINNSSFYENIASLSFQFILAVILILLLKYVFMLYGDFQFHYENLKKVINILVDSLQDLLIWLMGVPVGFKLNQPLSRVMGQFYMFHVTIWENYMLSIIYPFVPFLTGLIPWLTPLGICFFLCLFLDILSLFSLHIMCFYIYACKLYRLQVIIICSLYRLFHGQKWNPFRKRVDTGPPEIDRMFASTLILALCVFLLPTTAIYYLVFAAFKLIIYVIEYLICSVVEAIFQLPVLDFVTYILQHSRHKKIIEIQQISQDKSFLVLKLKFHMVRFLSIFKRKDDLDLNIRSNTGIANIIFALIKGTTF